MLKFLIILLAVYLFFRVFGKLILNAIVKLIFNKAYTDINKSQNHQSYSQNKPEGEVTVHKVDRNKNQQGDYVDYEEVN